MEHAASELHSDSMRDLQAHIQRDIEAMQEQLRSEHVLIPTRSARCRSLFLTSLCPPQSGGDTHITPPR